MPHTKICRDRYHSRQINHLSIMTNGFNLSHTQLMTKKSNFLSSFIWDKNLIGLHNKKSCAHARLIHRF